jgi:hypothetical protein
MGWGGVWLLLVGYIRNQLPLPVALRRDRCASLWLELLTTNGWMLVGSHWLAVPLIRCGLLCQDQGPGVPFVFESRVLTCLTYTSCIGSQHRGQAAGQELDIKARKNQATEALCSRPRQPEPQTAGMVGMVCHQCMLACSWCSETPLEVMQAASVCTPTRALGGRPATFSDLHASQPLNLVQRVQAQPGDTVYEAVGQAVGADHASRVAPLACGTESWV